jgi:hypothetical protein
MTGKKILLATVLVLIFKSFAAAQTITVNPGTTFQTISGWEATSQAGQESPAFPLYKNALFDQAANDLGINRLRLPVRSGAENVRDYWTEFRNGQISNDTWRCARYSTVNDNSDPFSLNMNGFRFSELDFIVEQVILPMKQRLEARGEHLYINVNYTAFTGALCPGLVYNHDDSPQEYAEFVLATFLHLQSKYNLVPDAWEVILEPDNTEFWRGQTIANAIVAAGNRLASFGFHPDFIACSTTSMANAPLYFDQMVQVPGVLQYLKEFSYHRYFGATDSNLLAIANRASQYGLRTSMLERIGSPYQDLHEDLKIGNNSSWQQFTLAFPTTDNGAQYYPIDLTDPANPVIVIGSRTKFLRQYFKFIRSGAVRIGASTTNTSFDPVAFINTNGKYAVVVKASTGGSITIQGLPAGTYGIKYTTSTQYDIDAADVTINTGGSLTASIPATGVITIYGKLSSTPACSYSMTPTSRSYPALGGTGTFTVQTSGSCAWSAVSNAGWVTITSGTAGNGNSSITFAVAQNTSTSPRSGTVSVAGRTFTVLQGARFLDVPPTHPFYTEIGKLSARGVTTGCTSGNFCPNQAVTREQMAAFIMRARGEFNPPAPSSQRFFDVPPTNPFYRFIDRMAVLNITLGCGGGNYCPSSSVTRGQMAAFLVRAFQL